MVFEKIFHLIDEDNSGEISIDELKKIISEFLSIDLPDTKIAEIFNNLDIDGSGEVDIEEFETTMNQLVENQFKAIDVDNSGNISPEELKNYEKSSRLDQDIVENCQNRVSYFLDEFLKVADKDGDGEISLDEFVDVIVDSPKIGLRLLFCLA